MAHRAILIAESCWVTARVIDAWIGAGHEIAEVWCFDESAKRTLEARSVFGMAMPGWDTAALIRRRGIPVRLCPALKTWEEAGATAARLGADVLMTVMTQHIVPEPLLRQFEGRAINVHPALLPHYKGPSPRMAMLVDGVADIYGGITIHLLTRRIDEGAIIGQRAVPFSRAAQYRIWDAMQAEAAGAIVETDVLLFLAGQAEARPQEAGSGNYRRIEPGEFRISPLMGTDHVRRLCEALGGSGLLAWKPNDHVERRKAVFFIDGFIRELGPAQARPPRVSHFHIDMDLADARVRLRRSRKLDRLWRSLPTLAWIRLARQMRNSWIDPNASPPKSHAPST